MTQEWGPSHYHFMVEHLPRITVMLDVLRQHEDIKVSWAVKQEGLCFQPLCLSTLYAYFSVVAQRECNNSVPCSLFGVWIVVALEMQNLCTV